MWRQEDNVGQSVEYPQSDAGRMVTRRDGSRAMHGGGCWWAGERNVSGAVGTVRTSEGATNGEKSGSLVVVSGRGGSNAKPGAGATAGRPFLPI